MEPKGDFSVACTDQAGRRGFACCGRGNNDRPTISYAPLMGRKFAQSLLQPIPPKAIFSLIVAGYPADVVIPAIVRAMNGVYNRTSQGGTRQQSDAVFDPLVDALRRVQLSRAISIRLEQRGNDQTAISPRSAR